MKKYLLIIWNYFRNSWEGEDGKFSYKRASQFTFVWLMVYMILNNFVNTRWHYYTFLTVAILFALTAAAITVPQLIQMIKEYSNKRKSYHDMFNHFSDNQSVEQVEDTTEDTK